MITPRRSRGLLRLPAPGLLLCLVACAPRPPSLPAGPAAEATPSGSAATEPPPAPPAPPASASGAMVNPPREPPAPPRQADPPVAPLPERQWPTVTRVGTWEHPEVGPIATHLSVHGAGCHKGKNHAIIRLTITTSDYLPGYYGPQDPHPPYPSLTLTVAAIRPMKGQMGPEELSCFQALSGARITSGAMNPRYLANHTLVLDVSVPGGP